jgi:general secretion pathway protein H
MTGTDQRFTARAGFTLLEVLLVLLIVSTVSALALPAVWVHSPRVRLEAQAGRILSALRLTRADAIRRNQEASVFVDTEHGTLSSTSGATTRLDRELEIGTTFAVLDRGPAATAGIRFFPTGQSSGGEIRLRRRVGSRPDRRHPLLPDRPVERRRNPPAPGSGAGPRDGELGDRPCGDRLTPA